MTESTFICFERDLPDELLDEADLIALEENPNNAPPPPDPNLPPDDLRLAIAPFRRWRPGSTLTVSFMDGLLEVQLRVIEIAHQWSEHANITFDFGYHEKADIRISFEQVGNWSMIGTNARVIPPGEPTMNFADLSPNSSDATFNRLVLHEFGHALGCIHEHQNPAGGIPWDEQAVIDDYSGPPNHWSEQKIRQNILNRGISFNFTEFDPKSIMLYPIHSKHTKGNFAIPIRNTKLSETDKKFIAKIYPR